MASQDIVLELHDRSVVRKGLQKLRQEGNIPAVIHDHGNTSILVMGDGIAMNKVYLSAGKHHPVQLVVGSDKHLALIKDVDIEPTKHILRHIVFQAIKQNETVSAEIPVILVGEIPAERLSLLVLTQLDHVEVESLPRDLPDQFTVDATKLEAVGDHLTVADIVVPKGVTITTDPEIQIAIVEMPKDQIAEADASAADLAADSGKPAEEVVEAETPTEV
ncbi:MAG: 50S ribosomal protein L25/general stress protein Ctc [Candidatus Saccharimonadales bacterium]